jgi:4-hydroxybenzoate polyprenyltransferase
MTAWVKKNTGFNLKKIPKIVWDEFVYGGHFLALGDVVALYVMALILGVHATWSFLVIIYLGVFSANLFNRSDESGHDALTNPVRVGVMSKYVRYQYQIVAICFAISVGLTLYYSNFMTLLFALMIFSISILYTTLFKKMTKYIVGLKSYVAALFYALMVFLLVIFHSVPISGAVVLMFVFYYIRIFISNAACDVKDIESDKKRGLKTIAISLGETRAMKFLNFLNLASGAVIVYGVYVKWIPGFSLALLLTIPYAGYYFYINSKVSSKEVFANAIVDGEFLLWLPFILLGKLFV